MAQIPIPQTDTERKLEALFEPYVKSGRQRSYGSLARRFDIPVDLLMRHAKKFCWGERVKALEIQQDQTSPSDDGGISNRHLSWIRQLQIKLKASVENAIFDNPATATTVLLKLIEAEREILGLNKDKDNDLATVMKELHGKMSKKTDDEDEFRFDPDLPVPDFDGKSANPSSGSPESPGS